MFTVKSKFKGGPRCLVGTYYLHIVHTYILCTCNMMTFCFSTMFPCTFHFFVLQYQIKNQLDSRNGSNTRFRDAHVYTFSIHAKYRSKFRKRYFWWNYKEYLWITHIPLCLIFDCVGFDFISVLYFSPKNGKDVVFVFLYTLMKVFLYILPQGDFEFIEIWETWKGQEMLYMFRYVLYRVIFSIFWIKLRNRLHTRIT